MPSRFNRVDYPAVGASYRSPSLPASAQRTVNLYPEVLDNGLVNVALHNFPGLNRKLSGNSGEFDRGFHTFKGNLYQVAGSQLYLVSSTYVRTAIGSIAGTGYVSMSDNGSTMVIVTGGSGEYTYDGSTFAAVTLGSNPSNVEYLNSSFYFDDDDGRVSVTTPGTLTIPGLNFFAPVSAPDSLVRTYIFNQFIYLFGERTIEPWQPVGAGVPPVERMNGAIVESVGLAGRTAVTNTEKAMYFVSDKGDAIQLAGFQTKEISTVAINNEWRQYSTTSDAIVQTVDILSLDFVIFSFPTAGKTWGYVEQYGIWFELETGTARGRWLGNTIIEAYGRNIVADYATGNIYELDPDVYTDNGLTTVRERIFAPLAGEKFQKPRQFYQFNEFGLSIETGLGNTAEINPLIGIAFSTDGGQTYSNERFKKVGQDGEYQKEVKVTDNKHFRDLTVRLRYTEPNKFSLFSSYIMIRESGRK
jgi:hypothetical protein